MFKILIGNEAIVVGITNSLIIRYHVERMADERIPKRIKHTQKRKEVDHGDVQGFMIY